MLRKTIQTPVIMLTNNGAEGEKIKNRLRRIYGEGYCLG